MTLGRQLKRWLARLGLMLAVMTLAVPGGVGSLLQRLQPNAQAPASSEEGEELPGVEESAAKATHRHRSALRGPVRRRHPSVSQHSRQDLPGRQPPEIRPSWRDPRLLVPRNEPPPHLG